MNSQQKYLLDSSGFVVAKAAVPDALINSLVSSLPSIDHQKFPFIDIKVGRELLTHHWIIHACRQIIGPHFRLDHTFGISQKQGSGENLHGGPFCCQGSCYYVNHGGKIHCGRVTVGIALTHQSPATGGFCYIPGSHKSGDPTGGAELLGKMGFENTVVPTLSPGDIYFFPDCLVHGCTPWKGKSPRVALYAGFCPGFAMWNSGPALAPETTLERALVEPPYVANFSPRDYVNHWRKEVPRDSAFQICRIIGNELPPRDEPGSKLRSLEEICQRDESGRRRYWIVNRIVDVNYFKQVINILTKYDAEYYIIPFVADDYRASEDKIHYLTNINPARNYGLSLGTSEYVACLDQDCFLAPDDYSRITKRMDAEPRDYYALTMRRCTPETLGQYLEMPPEEPQLILHRRTQWFDPKRRFGDDDKMALLRALGCQGRGKGFAFHGDRCLVVGDVIHLSYSDPSVEQDVALRVEQRRSALSQLVAMADRQGVWF